MLTCQVVDALLPGLHARNVLLQAGQLVRRFGRVEPQQPRQPLPARLITTVTTHLLFIEVIELRDTMSMNQLAELEQTLPRMTVNQIKN